MSKNEDDKNRIRFHKQNSGYYNRKVKQKKDELAKSLVGSITNLFQAQVQKSQSSTSSRIEEGNENEHIVIHEMDGDVNEVPIETEEGNVIEEEIIGEVNDLNEDVGDLIVLESVRAIRTQPAELRDALVEIANKYKNDNIVRVEAKCICQNALEDFEFLISLCILYTILDSINRVSKILQSEEMDIEDAIAKIKELSAFFEKFREDGFESMINEAKELADEVGIEPKFARRRIVRRKKHFDEDMNVDAHESQSLEDNFRTTYFLHIIDQALSSLKDRFEQFELYEGIFGFLLNAKFKTIEEKQLKEQCLKLESFLEHNQESDIRGK